MIKIKAVQKTNPLDPQAERKYYAQAIAKGVVDLERLALLVSRQCTVSEADCYAVMVALTINIEDELSQGKIVKLDRLGSFQVGLSSDGVATEEEVGGHLVSKTRLNFRPSKKLKSMLSSLGFSIAS